LKLIDVESFRRVTGLTDADVKFGLIPHDHWYQPNWIDEQKAADSRSQMMKDNVIYGGSVPYVWFSAGNEQHGD
jgi:alpha 1,2-mannosyltransferase